MELVISAGDHLWLLLSRFLCALHLFRAHFVHISEYSHIFLHIHTNFFCCHVFCAREQCIRNTCEHLARSTCFSRISYIFLNIPTYFCIFTQISAASQLFLHVHTNFHTYFEMFTRILCALLLCRTQFYIFTHILPVLRIHTYFCTYLEMFTRILCALLLFRTHFYTFLHLPTCFCIYSH